jgi:AcrR family transcriptional regulator
MEKLATRGRPREFDTEDALAAALGVFWRKGYDGASLTDLTEAMGITRPSLYAAFGNKEQLFTQALDLYEREKLAYVRAALDAPTARGVAERFLHGAIENVVGGSCRGCLGVIASVNCTNPEEGDFPVPVEAEAITRYMTTIMQGLSVQASAGASVEELQQVADAALAMWPGR